MDFHILSLFPEMVMQGLSTSITGRAMKQGKINIEAVNIRNFATDKHRRVDDYPYGGGAGMLMQAQPVYDAWRSVAEPLLENGQRKVHTIYVTPQGETFTQKKAEEFAKADDLVLLCGHYEGIDERVLKEIVTDYVSIGDYVLTGGELAAMVIVDAVARLVPGVLHNEDSARTETFFGELLEYPQYSRPEVWRGIGVPEVLLSGNQREIDRWRREQSVLRTRERRPDLFQKYQRLEECKAKLQKKKLLHMDMIELIDRGRAELFSSGKDGILLRDRISGIYYYTNLCREPEGTFGGSFSGLPEDTAAGFSRMAVHGVTAEKLEQLFTYVKITRCAQLVYTRREKLPVRGLYCPNGKESKSGLCIREIFPEECEKMLAECARTKAEEYFCSRSRERAVYGAFVHGEIAAAAGANIDGSLGMLYVRKAFRRQHIGMALGTYMINLELDLGRTPYVQTEESDAALIALWEKLGLYRAKEPVIWMEF